MTQVQHSDVGLVHEQLDILVEQEYCVLVAIPLHAFAIKGEPGVSDVLNTRLTTSGPA